MCMCVCNNGCVDVGMCVLVQENLLDCHEFLHWLVERVDHIKAADTKGLQLYLPLVLKVKGHLNPVTVIFMLPHNSA